ncbi:hypothetical protein [Thiorhodococcus mannitoliphagus]|uniref:hypothetical protein n=1 Tax=Thiorhodococcus mannitoliphagus TaxID=329406 RepID=UPI001F0D5563|nr:hypothetical protein [Thiorhodococcus mannitoliphagus]
MRTGRHPLVVPAARRDAARSEGATDVQQRSAIQGQHTQPTDLDLAGRRRRELDGVRSWTGRIILGRQTHFHDRSPARWSPRLESGSRDNGQDV